MVFLKSLLEDVSHSHPDSHSFLSSELYTKPVMELREAIEVHYAEFDSSVNHLELAVNLRSLKVIDRETLSCEKAKSIHNSAPAIIRMISGKVSDEDFYRAMEQCGYNNLASKIWATQHGSAANSNGETRMVTNNGNHRTGYSRRCQSLVDMQRQSGRSTGSLSSFMSSVDVASCYDSELEDSELLSAAVDPTDLSFGGCATTSYSAHCLESSRSTFHPATVRTSLNDPKPLDDTSFAQPLDTVASPPLGAETRSTVKLSQGSIDDSYHIPLQRLSLSPSERETRGNGASSKIMDCIELRDADCLSDSDDETHVKELETAHPFCVSASGRLDELIDGPDPAKPIHCAIEISNQQFAAQEQKSIAQAKVHQGFCEEDNRNSTVTDSLIIESNVNTRKTPCLGNTSDRLISEGHQSDTKTDQNKFLLTLNMLSLRFTDFYKNF